MSTLYHITHVILGFFLFLPNQIFVLFHALKTSNLILQLNNDFILDSLASLGRGEVIVIELAIQIVRSVIQYIITHIIDILKRDWISNM
jgi:hypothetical protein